MVYAWDRVWVNPREPSDTIVELDPANHDREGMLTVSGGAGRLATGAGLLWVPITHERPRWELVGVDIASGDEVVHARTGIGGWNVAYGEGAVWVSNHGESSLTRVDPETGKASTIDLGGIGQPSGIAVGFHSVWVSDTLNGVVYRVDPASGDIETVQIGDIGSGFQSDVAILDGSVWVTDPNDKAIVRIDPVTSTVTERIPLEYAPQDLIVGYGSVWVTVVEFPR
jgi:streptogramin lyase